MNNYEVDYNLNFTYQVFTSIVSVEWGAPQPGLFSDMTPQHGFFFRFSAFFLVDHFSRKKAEKRLFSEKRPFYVEIKQNLR